MLLTCSVLYDLAVLEEHRHKRVGTTLLEMALREVEVGSTVMVGAEPKAMTWYKRLGFEQSTDEKYKGVNLGEHKEMLVERGEVNEDRVWSFPVMALTKKN